MITENDLECGNCGRALSDCDCGVDREMRYRDRYVAQTRSDYGSFVVLGVIVAALLVLRKMFLPL